MSRDKQLVRLFLKYLWLIAVFCFAAGSSWFVSSGKGGIGANQNSMGMGKNYPPSSRVALPWWLKGCRYMLLHDSQWFPHWDSLIPSSVTLTRPRDRHGHVDFLISLAYCFAPTTKDMYRWMSRFRVYWLIQYESGAGGIAQ